MDLFAHAWARADRAAEIAQRMLRIWNDYLEQEPYSFDLLHEGGGVHVMRVREDVPMPQEFAVATGEWINHLRASLDYMIWATAAHVSGRVPPPKQGQLQFPIFDSLETWERGLSRLSGLGEHHREMLLAMQPFGYDDSDVSPLWWVNRIARSDRHRHLSRMTGYISECHPVVEVPDGCTITRQLGESVIVDGVAEAARFVVTPWTDGMSTRFNPRTAIDPEIEDWSTSAFWRQFVFSDRLMVMRQFVEGQIAAFEYDCTGRSRKAKFLTQEYRAQCDARRPDNPRWPARTREPVRWTEPVPVSSATDRELDGLDFPDHGPGSARTDLRHLSERPSCRDRLLRLPALRVVVRRGDSAKSEPAMRKAGRGVHGGGRRSDDRDRGVARRRVLLGGDASRTPRHEAWPRSGSSGCPPS